MSLLSVKEAAELLRLASTTVYGLCQKRLLRHERLGLGRGVIRIPEEALEEYRRRQTVVAAEAASMPPSVPKPRRPKLKHLA